MRLNGVNSLAQNFHVARRQVGVSNVLGLHLRVADKFVKLANTFQSEVQVHCKDIIANGKSILSLLCLAPSAERCWLSKPRVAMPRTPLPL